MTIKKKSRFLYADTFKRAGIKVPLEKCRNIGDILDNMDRHSKNIISYPYYNVNKPIRGSKPLYCPGVEEPGDRLNFPSQDAYISSIIKTKSTYEDSVIKTKIRERIKHEKINLKYLEYLERWKK